LSIVCNKLLELLRAEGLAVPEGTIATSLDPASTMEFRFDPEHTAAMLAEKIEALHALDVSAFRGPDVVSRVTMRCVVTEARRATVAAPDAPVDAAYAHMSRSALLEVLESGVQRLGELDEAEMVLTHGAPDLDALLCAHGRAVGFTSWDRVALADRHRDLAHAAATLAAAMGPAIVPGFFEHYEPRPVLARLDWWLLAQQLVAPTGAGNRSEEPMQQSGNADE
jgi:aminoglycoside phosphotransferase